MSTRTTSVGRGQIGFGARLRALRLARSLSQGELARQIGRHQTSIGPYERGEYAPPRGVLERLAQALDTTPEYLLFGRDPRRITVPLVGRAGPGGLVAELAPTTPPVRLADELLSALLIADDAMAPRLRSGQIALVRAVAVPAGDCLGRDALVELEDGRRLLRHVLPAAEPTRFDLALASGATLRSVVVVRAQPVLGVLWPEAAAVEGEMGRRGWHLA